jgi:hypothetical protein
MCLFITVALPRDVDIDVVAERFESHGRGFAVTSNPHVAAQLDQGDRYVLTTRAHCDCGTSLGALARSRTESGAQDANQWIELLSDLLGTGATTRISLLLHQYSGNVESERIVLKGRQRLEASELTTEQLMTIEEDVLYDVASAT